MCVTSISTRLTISPKQTGGWKTTRTNTVQFLVAPSRRITGIPSTTEGTRIKQGLSRISTVPLDNERAGDFSTTAAANAGVSPYATVYNLSTCSAPSYTATNCVPLVNNSFQSDPTAKIDTAVAKLIALFPEPNDKQGGATFPEFNNFARTGAATDFPTTATRPDGLDTVAEQHHFRPLQLLHAHPANPGLFWRPGRRHRHFGLGQPGSQRIEFGGWLTHIFALIQRLPLRVAGEISRAAAFLTCLSPNYIDFASASTQSSYQRVSLTAFNNHTYLGSPDFLPKPQVPMLYQFDDTVSWTKGAAEVNKLSFRSEPQRAVIFPSPVYSPAWAIPRASPTTLTIIRGALLHTVNQCIFRRPAVSDGSWLVATTGK